MNTQKTIRGSTVRAFHDLSLASTQAKQDWAWWISVEGSQNRIGTQALRQWCVWIITQIDKGNA